MKFLLGFFFLLSSFALQAQITIGAYNIRNFDYDQRSHVPTDKSSLLNILRPLKADVLSVEEINNTAEFERFIINNMPGYKVALSNCGGAHGQRLGFIYNSSKIKLINFDEDLKVSNPGGPGTCEAGSRPLAIALFEIKATGQKFHGIAAHLKSGSQSGSIAKRLKQFEIIKSLVKSLQSETGVTDVFIAGDLNTTEFLSRGTDYHTMNKFVSALGMVNLTKDTPCSAYWWGGSDDGIETPSLLDHLLVTPGLLKKSTKVQVHGHCQKVSCREASEEDLGISYQGVSDHCPLTATIQ